MRANRHTPRNALEMRSCWETNNTQPMTHIGPPEQKMATTSSVGSENMFAYDNFSHVRSPLEHQCTIPQSTCAFHERAFSSGAIVASALSTSARQLPTYNGFLWCTCVRCLRRASRRCTKSTCFHPNSVDNSSKRQKRLSGLDRKQQKSMRDHHIFLHVVQIRTKPFVGLRTIKSGSASCCLAEDSCHKWFATRSWKEPENGRATLRIGIVRLFA